MIFQYNNKNLFYKFYDRQKLQTVVFLHGWGGNHLSMVSLFDVFSDFNILTIDFWGFGQSEKPSEDFELYSYSSSLSQLVDFLNLDNLTLVGHSFGGRVSIVYAFESTKVKRLILIDSAGILPKKTLKKRVQIFKYKMIKKMVNCKIISKNRLEKYGSSDYRKLSSSERVVFNKIIKEDLSKYLDFIKQKTLLIWGEKDKDTPLYMAKKMNQGLENSQLFIIKGGTHFAYIEHNLVVKEKIKEFIYSE